MKKPLLLTAIRPWRGFLVALCITLLTTNPLLRAAAIENATQKRNGAPKSQAVAQITSNLSGLLEDARVVLEGSGESSKTKNKRDGLIDKRRLAVILEQVKVAHLAMQKEFGERREKLKHDTIKQRHDVAVADFEKDMTQLVSGLSALTTGPSDNETGARAGQMLNFLNSKQKRRPQQVLDPNKLPFSRSKEKARPPKETRQELTALFKGLGVSGKTSSTLPSAEYLAETEDVQIDAHIRELAQDLENNPVKIYNWVHNNILFTPSFGSIQGSLMTLEARRANAFDMANLLISLLRAANIPARYAYGTVEISAVQATDWLDVSSVVQAGNMLTAAGIPARLMIEDNTPTHIRLEHVWVEAFVDFMPSRGARNITGDTWIPMDASIKKQAFQAASAILADLPLDLAAMAGQLVQGAVIDPATGRFEQLDWVTTAENTDTYIGQLEDNITASGLGDTAEEVIGSKHLFQSVRKVLAAGLPFTLVARALTMARLPDDLRHAVTIRGYKRVLDRSLGQSDFGATVALPVLGSKRLSLTYDPASVADAQIIADVIASGTSSLPLYLIRVIPTLKIDEQVIALGSPVQMGSDQFLDVVLETTSGADIVRFDIVAGDENVFGINGSGIYGKIAQARLDHVPSETAAENLHQVALNYWMLCDRYNDYLGQDSDVHIQRAPSVGLFASSLTVNYSFGVPLTGDYRGRNMDIRRSVITVAGDTAERRRQVTELAGAVGSYLEGSTFDLLFERSPGASVSAIQLLLDAVKYGSPLLQIDATNAATALASLQIDATARVNIVAALDVGKHVLVNGQEIERAFWKGSGYIITDAQTGEGAYVITGDLNGGLMVNCKPKPFPVREVVRQIVRNLLMVLVIILAIIVAVYTLGTAIPALVKALLAGIIIGGATATANDGPTIFDDPCFKQWEIDKAFCAQLAPRYRRLCRDWAFWEYSKCNNDCERREWGF